jgi:hypothetical protein
MVGTGVNKKKQRGSAPGVNKLA